MSGPLPAGDYRLTASGVGISGALGNALHGELILRHGSDTLLGSWDSTPPGSDAGLPGAIDGTISVGTVDGQSGDLLIVRLSDTGPGFIELNSGLTIP